LIPRPDSQFPILIEVLGLTRIFHTGLSRGAANPDADKEDDGLRRRLYVSYCPRSNSKLTQYPSGFRKPQQNRHEIGGLNPFLAPDHNHRYPMDGS
jgi:hypothetical protein